MSNETFVVFQQIIAAAKEVRANGRGWDEALMVVKQTGYKGGLPGLRKLIRDEDKATAVTAPRKRGRPRKVALGINPTKDLSGIEAAIEAVVRHRVARMISKIRTALDEAEKAL